MKKIYKNIFNKEFLIRFGFFLLLSFILWFFVWMRKNFGRINFDEIAIVMQIGRSGVDGGLVWSFIRRVIIRSLIYSFVFTGFCYFTQKYKIIRKLPYLLLTILILYNGYLANIQLGSFFKTKTSQFYEHEYVFPDKAKITFSDKRNVLLIVLESMEKVYADKEVFGTNLTPNISKLEGRYISFENYHSISGLSHTIAAITGMTTGLPLFYTGFKDIEKMLGTTGIGTIMKQHGYSTTALFPASGQFSLKTSFLSRMGFDEVYDGERFRGILTYELSEYPFEGIDDGTLFKLSKPIIQDIIKSDKPYFIMMETLNTHCGGIYTQECKDLGFNQESPEDVIECEDKLVYDFVKWFHTQDPTAVIILLNDHKQHAEDALPIIKTKANRPLNNVFINTNIFNYDYEDRKVSAMDFFPTIIESAGGKIQGCKLGLGVSLSRRCKKIKTLRERYPDAVLEDKMEQSNDLYYKLTTGIDR